MKRVCGGCGKVMEQGTGKGITHGLCPLCFAVEIGLVIIFAMEKSEKK